MGNFHHISVLLEDSIGLLNIKEDGLYLDATVGGGGHSLAIAKKLTTGKLVAMDQDREALEAAKVRLHEYADKVQFIEGNFRHVVKKLMPYGLFGFDGILMDIGVSSHQIDTEDRGFTFLQDGPLDMRMDQSLEISAADILNAYNESDLIHILKDFAEERYAGRIARNIVQRRVLEPYETSKQLVDTVLSSLPREAKKQEWKSVMRVFQGMRIAVNDELGALEEAIPQMIRLLKTGGRLAIISFHSLEDRIVKNAFRLAESECVCPPKSPICTCNKKAEVRIITKKPIVATEDELQENTRSHSAKLRVIEKLGG
ncbi:MAG: 16S rRNA (cytosine(1402)-N(4))-methyltransferase RsmH [Tissierellia bacterium]|nr:16S rRNA (cytosine(1402)-N(4))-methyltransferase RsmH [Tissierellia bacterium]